MTNDTQGEEKVRASLVYIIHHEIGKLYEQVENGFCHKTTFKGVNNEDTRT